MPGDPPALRRLGADRHKELSEHIPGGICLTAYRPADRSHRKEVYVPLIVLYKRFEDGVWRNCEQRSNEQEFEAVVIQR